MELPYTYRTDEDGNVNIVDKFVHVHAIYSALSKTA